MFMKRHLKIGIKAPDRIDDDGERVNDAAGTETVTEKITKGAFYGGCFLLIPVYSKDYITKDKEVGIALVGDSDPDMIDDTWTINIGQYPGFTAFNPPDRRRAFAGWPQDTLGLSAAAFGTGRIFHANGTASAMIDERELIQAVSKGIIHDILLICYGLLDL